MRGQTEKSEAYTCGAREKYSSENFVGRGDLLDRILAKTYHTLRFSCPSDQPENCRESNVVDL